MSFFWKLVILSWNGCCSFSDCIMTWVVACINPWISGSAYLVRVSVRNWLQPVSMDKGLCPSALWSSSSFQSITEVRCVEWHPEFCNLFWPKNHSFWMFLISGLHFSAGFWKSGVPALVSWPYSHEILLCLGILCRKVCNTSVSKVVCYHRQPWWSWQARCRSYWMLVLLMFDDIFPSVRQLATEMPFFPFIFWIWSAFIHIPGGHLQI